MRRIFTHVAWCNLVPRGRVKTYSCFIVAANVNEFPYIFFPPIGGKESIRRLSMVYLIDNKVLSKAFVISRVRFTNFMPVRIIFNRIFSFFFFFILSPTNEPRVRRRHIFLANESGRETITTTTTTTHASIFSRGNPQKIRKTQSQFFVFDDETIWRG